MPLTLWVSENWLARKLAEQALWGPSLIRTGAIKRAGAGGVDCLRDGLLATRSYGSRGARSGFVLAKRDTQWWSSRCGSRPRAPCQKADATSLSSCSSDSMHYLHSALVLVKCLL